MGIATLKSNSQPKKMIILLLVSARYLPPKNVSINSLLVTVPKKVLIISLVVTVP
jgi:hypothetical protein